MSRESVRSAAGSQGDLCPSPWAPLVLASALAVAFLPSAAGQGAQPATPARGMTAYLDRSYYTSEAEARVVVVLHGSTPIPEDGKIVVKDGRGRVLREGTAAARSQLSIGVGDYTNGRHRLTVEWEGPDVQRAAAELCLVKRPPKPGY